MKFKVEMQRGSMTDPEDRSEFEVVDVMDDDGTKASVSVAVQVSDERWVGFRITPKDDE